MRIRNDINYQFDFFNDLDKLQIPPAIIHTLLENGITHNDPIGGAVHFKLLISLKDCETNIEFVTTGHFESNDKKPEGTGLDYIKSRLEENYPNNWNLETGPISDTQWKTLIRISK